MMHECPKCGFVQPKDKYCANCGLDIESYKPVPDSLFVRLSKNTGLQIAIVILIVIAMAIAIFISQRDRIAQHLANAIPSMKRSMPTSDSSKSQDSPTPTITAALRPEPPNAPPVAASPKSRSALNVVSSDVRKFKDLSVAFYEVSKAGVAQLATDGQILNETQQTKSFLLHVPDAIAKIKEIDPEARSHGEPHIEAFLVGTPFNLDFTHMGGKRTPEAVGLSLVLNPTAMTDGVWDFTVEANINLKNETGGSLLSTAINGSYSIPPKSALLLAGFLPHQKILKDDLWSFNGSPLMIYESPDFINGLTEFVIVIQPK